MSRKAKLLHSIEILCTAVSCSLACTVAGLSGLAVWSWPVWLIALATSSVSCCWLRFAFSDRDKDRSKYDVLDGLLYRLSHALSWVLVVGLSLLFFAAGVSLPVILVM